MKKRFIIKNFRNEILLQSDSIDQIDSYRDEYFEDLDLDRSDISDSLLILNRDDESQEIHLINEFSNGDSDEIIKIEIHQIFNLFEIEK